jgi:putative transcriptional regulator
MNIAHHPSSEMLAAYSAGSLPLSNALCISAHVEMCKECQTNMLRLDCLGAHVFSDLKPAVVDHGLKDSVLSLLDSIEPTAAQGIMNRPRSKDVPYCLSQFIPKNFEDLEWTRFSFSIRRSYLCTDENGAQLALVRIKPGGSTGHHTHTGDEVTMLLKGAFSDESGLYQKGDFVLRDSRHTHRPVATKDGECICLTVVDAPIQFTGFFTRWLNPLVRRSYSS